MLCVIVLIAGGYYYYKRKKVNINEKNNVEFFYVIDANDNILKTEKKYICSQHRIQDLQNVIEMDIIQ